MSEDGDLRVLQPAGQPDSGRLDDLDRGDLLAEQEAGHVDLVHQRVSDHHRGVEARRHRGVRCAQCITSGWPSSPPSISIFSCWYSGSNRRMKPTWISGGAQRGLPAHHLERGLRIVVNGFSHITGLPCSRQASSCFSCVGPGVASSTHRCRRPRWRPTDRRPPEHRGPRRHLLGLLGHVVVHHGDTEHR